MNTPYSHQFSQVRANVPVIDTQACLGAGRMGGSRALSDSNQTGRSKTSNSLLACLAAPSLDLTALMKDCYNYWANPVVSKSSWT